MQCNSVAAAVFAGVFGLMFCLTSVWGEGGLLNADCQVVTDCHSPGYVCHRNFTCQCYSYLYRPNKERSRCVGIINQKCDYDEDCIEGAFCKEQEICRCKKHLVPNEDNTECSHSARTTANKLTVLPILVLLYLKLYLWIG